MENQGATILFMGNECHESRVCDYGEHTFIFMTCLYSLFQVTQAVKLCMRRSKKCEQQLYFQQMIVLCIPTRLFIPFERITLAFFFSCQGVFKPRRHQECMLHKNCDRIYNQSNWLVLVELGWVSSCIKRKLTLWVGTCLSLKAAMPIILQK